MQSLEKKQINERQSRETVQAKREIPLLEFESRLRSILDKDDIVEIETQLKAFEKELETATVDIDAPLILIRHLKLRGTLLGMAVDNALLLTDQKIKLKIEFLLKLGANPTFRPQGQFENESLNSNFEVYMHGATAIEWGLRAFNFKTLKLIIKNPEHANAQCRVDNVFFHRYNIVEDYLTPLECVTSTLYQDTLIEKSRNGYTSPELWTQVSTFAEFLLQNGAKITPIVIRNVARAYNLFNIFNPAFILNQKQALLATSTPLAIRSLEEQTIYFLSKIDYGSYYLIEKVSYSMKNKSKFYTSYFFPRIILEVLEVYNEPFQVMEALNLVSFIPKGPTQIILDYYLGEEFESVHGKVLQGNDLTRKACAAYFDKRVNETLVQVMPVTFSIPSKDDATKTTEKTLLCSFDAEALKDNPDPKACTWLFSGHYVKQDLSPEEDNQLCQAITAKRHNEKV